MNTKSSNLRILKKATLNVVENVGKKENCAFFSRIIWM